VIHLRGEFRIAITTPNDLLGGKDLRRPFLFPAAFRWIPSTLPGCYYEEIDLVSRTSIVY